MKHNDYIDFVLVTSVEGMHFQPHRPKGMEFIASSEGHLRFVLTPAKPEEDASGHRMGLTCKVYKSYTATEEQKKFVSSWNDERKITGTSAKISLPYKINGEILISADGKFAEGYSPRRHLCPPFILDLIEFVELDLYKQAGRFLKLLRWRQDCDGPGEVLKHTSLYWRVGEGDYPHVPQETGLTEAVTIKGMFGIHWSESHKSNLQNLWESESVSEPLGHSLLREATALSHESPRSAVLMMATALETAVKTHISKIAPDTAWLMENLSSPPIFKILRDYIPLVHQSKGNELKFWDKLKPEFTKVQKLIEHRNKIAHTGNLHIDIESMQDYTDLVSDFLYLIDVLDGHEWAKSLVSHTLRKRLEWPEPIDKRVSITISEIY